MSIKPNVIGAKGFYLNPGVTTFDTTDLAAIDQTFSGYDLATMSPYAYSATVRDDYDARRFATVTASNNIAATSRLSFGLFLSPENDKKNLLFQLMGNCSIFSAGGTTLDVNFFFGRKATDNTVVSSKAAPQNTLAAFTMLPAMSRHVVANLQNHSINSEIVSLELSGGFVYVFGCTIGNYSSAVSGGFDISLAFRKWGSEYRVYTPVR